MILSPHQGCAVIFTLAVVIGPGAAASSCVHRPPGCASSVCERTLECSNGRCSVDGRSCDCHPCYQGNTCADYVDTFPPGFVKTEDAVAIDTSHNGYVYQAIVMDKDMSITCRKSVDDDEMPECPCGNNVFSLEVANPKDWSAFTIDDFTGVIQVGHDTVLIPFYQYVLQIVARNLHDENEETMTRMNLTINVESSGSNQYNDEGQEAAKPIQSHFSHQDHDLQAKPEKDNNNMEPLSDDVMNNAIEMQGNQSLSRRKRSAPGTGAGAASMKLVVTKPSSDPTTLYPGQTVEYDTEIVLPRLTGGTDMDLVVEIFVMDAVTGITPFVICSVEITDVGSMVKDKDGNSLDRTALNSNIKTQKNKFLPSVTDRAVVDFGTVTNDDVADTSTGADLTDSTIKIHFTVTLIKNKEYTPGKAYVTVGSEYDSQNYIWVSQAEYSFEMDPSFSYPSDITIDGQQSVKEYSGATFELSAAITDPVGPFLLEVYTPSNEHNKFTVSGISIDSIGDNMKCTGDPPVTHTYYPSINNRTFYRAQASFDLTMTGLEYPNLFSKLIDNGNQIRMSFTVFFVEAKADDIVQVAAGIFIGSTTLFTAVADVTIEASDGPPTSVSAAYTVAPIGTNRVVAQNSALTWGITIAVPKGKNTLVKCTVSPVANHIVNVVWGKAGSNIALRPPLSDKGVVTYDAATNSVTAWEFNINSTGYIVAPADVNNAVLEVSVTYATGTPATVTVTCDGNALALDGAQFGSSGSEDMSGTAEPVNKDDAIWYQGSQQGLIAVLTFPAGGVPYNSMKVESNGDFEITGFDAAVCKMEILKAGRGVPHIAGPLEEHNKAIKYENPDPSKSKYNNMATLTTGGVAGTNRGAEQAPGDDQVIIRVAYQIPKNETVGGEVYNMSLGILFETTLIWTGWIGLTTEATAPTASLSTSPIIELIPAPVIEVKPGVPSIFWVKMKLPTGSVTNLKMTVSLADVSTLSICRLIIVDVGSSYPCVDTDPYGKQLLNAGQVTTIIHDPDEWGKSAALDFGVLRNLGYQEYYSDSIADSDSIIVGVVMKGIVAAATPTTVTVDVDHIGGPSQLLMNYTVAGTLTPAGTVTKGVWTTKDSTNEASDEVMKVVDLVLTFPEDYSNSLVVEISNADPASMRLCSAAVAIVGKNLPCVIPHLVVVTPAISETAEKLSVDIAETCYYIQSQDAAENTISIRVGIQLTSQSSGGTISAILKENGAPSATTIPDYSVTLAADPFDPDSINTKTEGFLAELADNTTVDVSPGSRMFVGINIIIPPDTMGKVEVGAMTPTDSGRAYATVHGFRWSEVSGKNVGCMMAIDNYDVKLIQNSSLGSKMIHESQTDTMVVDLGYMTNLGISYLQNFPKEPDDNAIGLEVEIMMADHVNATADSIIPISIAIKFADVIYVVTKNLKLVRDDTTDLMKLRTEFIFSDPAADTLFNRVTNKQLGMTVRMSHAINESRQEANDAIVRVMLPPPVQFVKDDDTELSNITSIFTNNHYLDFAIGNLFFTDYLEINLTVTLDPNNDMKKGLGEIDAAALLRLVCTSFVDQVTPRYCGTSTVLPFKIDGSECFDSLGINVFEKCQFSASTAIDASTGPEFSHSTGWRPAARGGPGWKHHITINFLKKIRVSKITFTPLAGMKEVEKFQLEFSNDGIVFTPACGTTQISVTEATLPTACKFEARYGRLIIVDETPDSNAFGVKFEWFGCALDTQADVCIPLPTTFTDSPGWRQIAHDPEHNIFYFCDYSPTKGKNVCFSTSDGATWNALPAYIGNLVGYDAATKLFYAKDHGKIAIVSSNDGVNWIITSKQVDVTAKDVPGNPSNDFTVVTTGDYQADFTGIKLKGAYVAKWESCCS